MERRRLLRSLVAGGAIATAGCTGVTREDDEETDEVRERIPVRTPGGVETVVDGVELPVPGEEIRRPLPTDGIPAIVDPAFAEDWSGLDPDGVDDPRLPAESPVLGVERDGEARAYPLRILNRHEIVNDEFGGPIAVTYCVLCGSGVVVERTVDGEETRFGVSGKLWRNDLVMYDEATESLWSQLLATAIRGPRVGERLDLVPVTLTDWGSWQETHPGTAVLLPPPKSGLIAESPLSFDYFDSKYSYEREDQLIGRDNRGNGLYGKTMVVGVEADDEARAYPFHVVEKEGVINDRVGSLPVVVSIAADDTLTAYDRRVGGETLVFEASDRETFRGGGSRWLRRTGEAIDGPHRGQRLDRANEHPPLFWTGWSNFNPDTDVYGLDPK
ncbi:DUF3179 domain-containing protein [Halovenus sp. WSH3]|uniref:DUF3179 domain-containing protein n=1 Tax=Halovenus carboxidivorans TaxID=2692199 RepID=A0A6B0TAM3_9EURY|nr:DUF3179 domain-containing protein [Halovenus carboxidivorans]MXR50229.1 DUF3179 domain-containing protein [Halovenus carboxidivorans]